MLSLVNCSACPAHMCTLAQQADADAGPMGIVCAVLCICVMLQLLQYNVFLAGACTDRAGAIWTVGDGGPLALKYVITVLSRYAEPDKNLGRLRESVLTLALGLMSQRLPLREDGPTHRLRFLLWLQILGFGQFLHASGADSNPSETSRLLLLLRLYTYIPSIAIKMVQYSVIGTVGFLPLVPFEAVPWSVWRLVVLCYHSSPPMWCRRAQTYRHGIWHRSGSDFVSPD